MTVPLTATVTSGTPVPRESVILPFTVSCAQALNENSRKNRNEIVGGKALLRLILSKLFIIVVNRFGFK
jgi:hypothetical protein